MSVFSICAFSGTGKSVLIFEQRPVYPIANCSFSLGLGPALMGWVEEKLPHGWRWIEWIQISMTFVTLVLLIFCTEETRGKFFDKAQSED